MPYKAFISYSHAADGKLAPALERGLERFAKPWNRARALHIFRDQSDLGINPHLWTSVESALSDSEFFLLLASPEAAASRWVPKEIAFWKEHRSADRLLLVLTDGEISWDPAAGDFDWLRTTALPRALEGFFEGEPLYLDLRWARTAEDLDLDHPRFREAIAGLASTLHGRPKADLDSEEVRQARRSRRLARGAIAGLSLLLLTTAAGAWIANSQRGLADERAAIATSRELAAAALANLDRDPELSLLLALHAVGHRPTTEAAQALDRAVHGARVRRTLTGHSDGLTAVSFSPDGSLLATVSDDETVRIWDTSTGEPRGAPLEHGRGLVGVAFSGGGRRLTTVARAGRVTTWELETDVGPVTQRIDRFEAVAFDRDLRRVATTLRRYPRQADEPYVAKVMDLETGEEVQLAVRDLLLRDLAMSSDGGRVAIGSRDGTATVWDGATGEELQTVKGNVRASRGVERVALSPDGRRLATLDRFAGKVWDVPTGEELVTLKGPTERVLAAAFSPDGDRLATAHRDRTARVWDAAETGELLLTLIGHTGAVSGVAFSPDASQLATASDDGTAKLWDLGTIEALVSPPGGYLGDPWITLHAGDARTLVTTSSDDTTRVWDARTREAPLTLSGRGSVTSPSVSGDRRALAAIVAADSGSDLLAKVWDLATGDTRVTVTGPDGIRRIALSHDGGRLAAASNDSVARVLDLTTDSVLTLPKHADDVSGMAFSLDGTLLATAAGNTAKVWDALTGQVRLTLIARTDGFSKVGFSPDGTRLITSSADNRILKIWDAQSGEEVVALGGAGSIRHWAFSTDGSRLAVKRQDQPVRVRDATTGRELMTLTGSESADVLSFSRDGRLATLDSGGEFKEWPIDIDGLVDLARKRVTRSLTSEECRFYLFQDTCPPTP